MPLGCVLGLWVLVVGRVVGLWLLDVGVEVRSLNCGLGVLMYGL